MTPNRITKADFDGWVEQRGSKFWSTWDTAYTPMLATWDKGQPPQKGGWLHATYGKGHYTYFAYAFHRQLPYGVPAPIDCWRTCCCRARRQARQRSETGSEGLREEGDIRDESTSHDDCDLVEVLRGRNPPGGCTPARLAPDPAWRPA